MTKFFSTKLYDHSEGLSCVFRQWKAGSNCAYIHGYAISVKFVFAATELDDRNWVVDFGGLKDIKAWLKELLDHTCCIAEDDPEILMFQVLAEKNLIRLRILPKVGCEGFAEYILKYVDGVIRNSTNNRCWVHSVEIREHGANSAIAESTDQCATTI